MANSFVQCRAATLDPSAFTSQFSNNVWEVRYQPLPPLDAILPPPPAPIISTPLVPSPTRKEPAPVVESPAQQEAKRPFSPSVGVQTEHIPERKEVQHEAAADVNAPPLTHRADPEPEQPAPTPVKHVEAEQNVENEREEKEIEKDDTDHQQQQQQQQQPSSPTRTDPILEDLPSAAAAAAPVTVSSPPQTRATAPHSPRTSTPDAAPTSPLPSRQEREQSSSLTQTSAPPAAPAPPQPKYVTQGPRQPRRKPCRGRIQGPDYWPPEPASFAR